MFFKPKSLLLCAGLGSRLGVLTECWPKCLMPVGGRPLLEYWLGTLYANGIEDVLVNLHHHADKVRRFLDREQFRSWVDVSYEKQLLGTAGTLYANARRYELEPVLLIHADNWCLCNFEEFIRFHSLYRPAHTALSMMTFRTSNPSSCGIVDIDHEGVVQAMVEKPERPLHNLANGAVYMVEPEVVAWIKKNPNVKDFSTEVLPQFFGRIATWENVFPHRDIGTIESLCAAQSDPIPPCVWPEADWWSREFLSNEIHNKILNISSRL